MLQGHPQDRAAYGGWNCIRGPVSTVEL